MSQELQPMAVQYYCHMSPSISRYQYTAMPLEGVPWSRDTDIYLTHIGLLPGFVIILTQFYVNFSRQEHQIDVLYVSFKS